MSRIGLACVLAAVLLPLGLSARAEDRIVFLKVRFDSAGVALESTWVVAGKLKSKGQEVAHDEQLTLRVLDGASHVLHTEAIDDPRYILREYAREDGTLGRVVEVHASAVTVIRFPFDGQVSRVDFIRSADKPASSKIRPLGSLRLDLSAYENKK